MLERSLVNIGIRAGQSALLCRVLACPRIHTALFGGRRYCSKSSDLKFIPHQFSSEEASKRFAEAASKRIFAPAAPEGRDANAIELKTHNPLQKVLLPYYGINVTVNRTDYWARYAINRTETYTSVGFDSKGRSFVQWNVRVVPDWYSIQGSLGSARYDQEENGMKLYAGFGYSANRINAALKGSSFTHLLRAFDPEKVESDAIVDPFLKRYGVAHQEAKDLIEQNEILRIKNHIERQTRCDDVDIRSYTVVYGKISLSSFMLPVYLLQYPHMPPQVLPAISRKSSVHGQGAFSVAKCASAAGLLMLVPSVFLPATIPARVALWVGSTALTGLWAKYNHHFANWRDDRSIRQGFEANEAADETVEDILRRKATTVGSSSSSSTAGRRFSDLNVERHVYDTMGLDPYADLSERDVQAAFSNKIKVWHPDVKGGSTEKAQKLIQARNVLLEAIKSRHASFR